MLKGKNISLRNLKESDIDFLQKIENNPTLWEFGSEQKVYTKQELLSYIKNSKTPLKTAKQYRFVVDYNNTPIGFVDLFNYKKKSASVGIIINEKHQNKGFAKESLKLLSDYCFNVFGLNQLSCSVGKDNVKSNKLFLSASYKFLKEENKLNFYIFEQQ